MKDMEERSKARYDEVMALEFELCNVEEELIEES